MYIIVSSYLFEVSRPLVSISRQQHKSRYGGGWFLGSGSLLAHTIGEVLFFRTPLAGQFGLDFLILVGCFCFCLYRKLHIVVRLLLLAGFCFWRGIECFVHTFRGGPSIHSSLLLPLEFSFHYYYPELYLPQPGTVTLK